MVDMVRKNYLPAIVGYLGSLAGAVARMKSVSERVKCHYEISTMERLSELSDEILEQVEKLEAVLKDLQTYEDIIRTSEAVRDDVLPAMDALRSLVDEAEMLSPESCWPFPSYGKLLFSVN